MDLFILQAKQKQQARARMVEGRGANASWPAAQTAGSTYVRTRLAVAGPSTYKLIWSWLLAAAVMTTASKKAKQSEEIMQRRRRLYPIRGRESPNRKTHASKAAEPKRCMQSERERERETIVRTCQWSSRRKKKGGNRRREARQWAGLLSSRIRCRHP